tara:strand:- start:799 stop:1389 length:591 start_codon:yes stop_codon:yes gene_type:complete
MLINKQIYFAHIPRTGGRYIYKNLFKEHLCEHADFDLGELYDHREIPHLTFPEYEEYLNKNIDQKFAVIRDPVTRFVSQLKSSVFKDRIESILKDQESLNKFINDALIDKNNLGNWFVPQIKFLDYKTKLWKFEDGLQDNFFKWLTNNFGLQIKSKKLSSDYFINGIDIKFNVELNNNQVNYIKNYYYQDYKVLGY